MIVENRKQIKKEEVEKQILKQVEVTEFNKWLDADVSYVEFEVQSG